MLASSVDWLAGITGGGLLAFGAVLLQLVNTVLLTRKRKREK